MGKAVSFLEPPPSGGFSPYNKPASLRLPGAVGGVVASLGGGLTAPACLQKITCQESPSTAHIQIISPRLQHFASLRKQV